MSNEVIVVGSLAGDIKNPWDDFPFQHKLNTAGGFYPHGHRSVLPNYQNTYGLSGIAMDGIGNTYLACRLRSYNAEDVAETHGEEVVTTYKLDPNGNVIWTANHGCNLYSIAIDSSGNVYTFGDAINSSGAIRTNKTQTTGYATTRCYNSSGVLQWSADHGWNQAEPYAFPCPSKIVYRNSYVYTTGYSYAGGTGDLVKYNASTGAIIWKAVTSSESYIDDIIWDICIDSSDNVYLAGLFFNPPIKYPPIPLTYIVKKYNSSGSFVDWLPKQAIRAGIYPTGRAIRINSSGNLIIAMSNFFSGTEGNYHIKYFLKYSAGFSYISEGPDYVYGYTSNNIPIAIALDTNDNIYAVSISDRAYGVAYRNVHRYNSALSGFDWEQVLYTSGQQIAQRGMAVDAFDNEVDVYCLALAEVETPPLAIKIAPNFPTFIGDKFCLANSLALPIRLSDPFLFKDYVGVWSPAIYRAYLAGPSPIELPIHSLSIRSDIASTTLSLVSSFPSLSVLSQIQARIGQLLTIQRGVRLMDGTDQLDTLLAVALDSIRYDQGSRSATITLAGSALYQIAPLKFRALRGISYRNAINGIRRVRCAVDTYLQIGDTASLGGGETLTVAEITIAVDPNQETMEVVE